MVSSFCSSLVDLPLQLCLSSPKYHNILFRFYYIYFYINKDKKGSGEYHSRNSSQSCFILSILIYICSCILSVESNTKVLEVDTLNCFILKNRCY